MAPFVRTDILGSLREATARLPGFSLAWERPSISPIWIWEKIKPPQVKGNLPTRTPGSLSHSNPHAATRTETTKHKVAPAHDTAVPHQLWRNADTFFCPLLYLKLRLNVFWLLSDKKAELLLLFSLNLNIKHMLLIKKIPLRFISIYCMFKNHIRSLNTVNFHKVVFHSLRLSQIFSLNLILVVSPF